MTPDEFTKRVITPGRPTLAVFCGDDEPSDKTEFAASDFARGTRYRTIRVNVADSPELVEDFLILATPTLIVFHNSQPVATAVGLQTVDDIARLTAGATQ